MKANVQKIKESAEFTFSRLSDAVSCLQARDINSGELIDTKVLIYADDIGISSELSNILVEISEKASKISENREGITEEDLSNAVLDTLPEDASDTLKNEVKLLVSTHMDLFALEQISKFAIGKFDSIFGEGAFNSIIVARYGRAFTPSLLLVIKIISFISEYGSLFAASELSGAIKKIKERTNNV